MTISTTARQIAEEWAAPGTVPDLELAILRHMEHHLAAERERCAKIVDNLTGQTKLAAEVIRGPVREKKP